MKSIIDVDKKDCFYLQESYPAWIKDFLKAIVKILGRNRIISFVELNSDGEARNRYEIIFFIKKFIFAYSKFLPAGKIEVEIKRVFLEKAIKFIRESAISSLNDLVFVHVRRGD